MLPGKAEPLKLQSKEEAAKQKYDLIPGFVHGKNVEHPEHFPAPQIPPGYKPVKVFPSENLAPGQQIPYSLIDLLSFCSIQQKGSLPNLQ